MQDAGVQSLPELAAQTNVLADATLMGPSSRALVDHDIRGRLDQSQVVLRAVCLQIRIVSLQLQEACCVQSLHRSDTAPTQAGFVQGVDGSVAHGLNAIIADNRHDALKSEDRSVTLKAAM